MAVFGSFFGYGWRIVGMFFIGAAMMKAGFFEGRQRQWVTRLATGSLGLGLAMELVAETGRMCAVELVEINPILDVSNKTGILAMELILSALGKRIFSD